MKLRRRIQRHFPNQEAIAGEALDGVKMSEVLEEFIAPYRDIADTEDAFHLLMATAVVAWNTALFPPVERKGHIDLTLEDLPPELRAGGQAFISELIDWKERDFAAYRRMILDYKITDFGQDYHLVVLSTADGLAENCGAADAQRWTHNQKPMEPTTEREEA